MKNSFFLFTKNQNSNKQKKKFPISYSKEIKLRYQDEVLSGSVLKKLIDDINSVKNSKHLSSFPLLIELECKSVIDKLTYIVFECICYNLIKQGHSLRVKWYPNIDEIYVQGLRYSPLRFISNFDNKIKRRKAANIQFLSEFEKKKTEFRHFRKLLKYDENTKADLGLSKVYEDISYIFKHDNVSEEISETIAEVVIELLANSDEHAHTDCLLDIDISDCSYRKKTGEHIDNEHEYFSINIAMINFSENLLGSGLKTRLTGKDSHAFRYQKVLQTHGVHRALFNDKYTENHFWILASMQDKISGEESKGISGGTGLAVLVRSLQQQSEDNSCYVITGNVGLRFIKEYLAKGENEWWGFNKTNDFLNSPPAPDVPFDCPIIICGTAYNLAFIAEKGD